MEVKKELLYNPEYNIWHWMWARFMKRFMAQILWHPTGSQDPSLQNCFPAGRLPSSTHVCGIPPYMQDFAFSLVELHEIPLSLNPQPVQIPPNGSTAIWSIYISPLLSSFVSSTNILALYPSIQVIIEEHWSL